MPLLILVLFGWGTLVCACGRTSVSIEHDTDVGKVFTGTLILGRTQAFKWSAVKRIDEALVVMGRGKISPAIAIVGDKPVVFGGLLLDAQRLYFLETLRKLLAARCPATESRSP